MDFHGAHGAVEITRFERVENGGMFADRLVRAGGDGHADMAESIELGSNLAHEVVVDRVGGDTG
jgi:hypothetical protein